MSKAPPRIRLTEWAKRLEAPPDGWERFIVTPMQALTGARPFCDPRGVGCGVYLVLRKRRLRLECVYVGSSQHLSSRLRNSDHMPLEAPTFAFEVPHDLRLMVETCYYFALRPAFNRKAPSGCITPPVMVQAIKAAWGKGYADAN